MLFRSQTRAWRLADHALEVWPAPRLDTTTLAKYRPHNQSTLGVYSIDDHPNITSPQNRDVFEAFRAAIFALDECVVEEFKKYYVAYKAETNFVDGKRIP